MKKVLYLAILTVLVAITLLGCDDNDADSDSIRGSGDIVTIDENFNGFSKIDLSHAFDAIITRDDSFSIVLRVDDNIVDYVNTRKSGDTLKIYLDSGLSYRNVTLEVDITVPDLEGLFLSGASMADISGFNSDHDFRFELSGASTVSGTLETQNVTGTLSGASRLSLEGSGEHLDTDVSGASTLELGDFTSQDADITLSGASKGTVNTAGRLDADVSGASTLYYIGEPTMGDINTSGASTLKKK